MNGGGAVSVYLIECARGEAALCQSHEDEVRLRERRLLYALSCCLKPSPL